jgi:hypothetical protein
MIVSMSPPRLSSPSKIQDYLNGLRFNFKDTCYSPQTVVEKREAHCAEGAIFAAAALQRIGFRPLIVDMEAAAHDFDHMVAVYQINGRWGAISKTNHAVLRFRDPVYNSIRELAMSYFHEYTDKKGYKTLRTFSLPFDLSRYDKRGWETSKEDVWYIIHDVIDRPHRKMLWHGQAKSLRRIDPIERQAGEIVEWQKKK